MLAIVRCVCVCYDDTFCLNRHLNKRPSASIVIILSLFILIPAVIWPLVMYYASNATGHAFEEPRPRNFNSMTIYVIMVASVAK